MNTQEERQRWERAQQEEKQWWAHNEGKSRKGKNRDHTDYWARTFHKLFDIDFNEIFADKDVFEIGPGPTGAIYWIKNARSRAAIEPMEMPDIEAWKRRIVEQGIGEDLKHPHASFDFLLCINVLDHCINPEKVLTESCRILRKGGVLFLYVHTINPKYRWLSPILNRADGPHPYHVSLGMLKRWLAPYFEIERLRVRDGVGVEGKIKSRGNVKIFFGNIVMQTVSLTLKKKG